MRPSLAALLGVPLLVLPLLACRGPFGLEVKGRLRPVTAADGTPLVVYELFEGRSDPDRPPRGWLFYVQGSERRSVTPSVERLAGAVALGLRTVLVERRGIGADGRVDEAAALAGCSKPQRVADHRRVLEHVLEGADPAAPVILLGASEGGDVAAAVAAQVPRVTHLALLDSGGGWCQADELRHLLRSRGSVVGLTRPEELEAAFQRIRRAPEAPGLWAGHPHARWSSFLWDRPLDDLLGLSVPVFLAQGDEDLSVPVESARALAAAFRAQGKTNLTYREYAGYGHGLRRASDGALGFPLLEADLVAWLAGQGVLTRAEAELAALRVRRAHPALFPPAPGVGR